MVEESTIKVLAKLLESKREALKRYREHKMQILDFDIREYYDILQTATEVDETKLSLLQSLKGKQV